LASWLCPEILPDRSDKIGNSWQPIEIGLTGCPRQSILHVARQAMKIAVTEKRQGFQRELRVEHRAIDLARTDERAWQINPTIIQEGVDIEIVFRFGALLNDGRLGSSQVKQRRDLNSIVGGDKGRNQPAKRRQTEERNLDGSAAINGDRKRVRLLLSDCRAGEEGQGGRKPGGLESAIAEEIEVNRCAVSEMQGKGRSAIKHELPRHSDELIPQPALRGGKHAQAWLEVGAHFLLHHIKINTVNLDKKYQINQNVKEKIVCSREAGSL
jgi:hypothetical protein